MILANKKTIFLNYLIIFIPIILFILFTNLIKLFPDTKKYLDDGCSGFCFTPLSTSFLISIISILVFIIYSLYLLIVKLLV